MLHTIAELEEYYYGSGLKTITKADTVIGTGTAGTYNAIYGAQVWAQINQEANAFGVLPKTPWNKSGWRIQSTRAGSTADGGIAEGGAIPDATTPSFVELSTKPKTVSHAIAVSQVQNLLATKTEDDVLGEIAQLRAILSLKHREAINQQLLADVSAAAATATADYTETTSMESLDRVVSNDSEEDAFGGTYNGWFDIYGVDRDDSATSGTTYGDAYVDHNSGTDRDLTDEMVRTALTTIKSYGGNTTVIITGYDTYSKLVGIYTGAVRYEPLGQANATIGVNGINTEKGLGFGVNVATLYGIPLIISKDTPKDTISRMYFLDTSDPEGYGTPRTGIDMLQLPLYFEERNPFVTGKFATKLLFETVGEIKCRFFKANGKIRDLK